MGRDCRTSLFIDKQQRPTESEWGGRKQHKKLLDGDAAVRDVHGRGKQDLPITVLKLP